MERARLRALDFVDEHHRPAREVRDAAEVDREEPPALGAVDAEQVDATEVADVAVGVVAVEDVGHGATTGTAVTTTLST